MFKKLATCALSLTLSGVIAVTSLTPTMAEANTYNRNNISQDELIGGLIFGAIALYALSEASKNKKSSKSASKKTEPVRLPKPKPPHSGHKPGHGHGHYAGHGGHRKALPTSCLRRTSGNHGPNHFFGRKCLRETYRGYNHLPRACFSEFRTTRGWRVGFGPRCLRRNGYTW